MVDSSALKLLNKSDPDKDDLPREIDSLCGQKFVFCLQLSDYNIKQGSDIFTVIKVFDPDYELEKKYNAVYATTETNLPSNIEDDLTEPSNNVIPTTARKRKFIVDDDDED